MESWLVFAILALVIYGLWGFFPKLAVSYISPQSALVFEVVGAIIVGAAVLMFIKFKPDLHPKGVIYSVLTGIAGISGTLLFFMAVEKGKVSVVVSLTALYPVITILLAFLLLNEPITTKQFSGVVLAIAAIYLLAS